jgi:hypothetical protein
VSAPQLTAQAQGVAVVSADQLNTFVQWTDAATDLRSFSGLSGMQVQVAGNAAVGDGGAGVFRWNAASTASDNGTSIIAPTGTAVGRWVRLGYYGTTPSAGYVLVAQVQQELALVDLSSPPAVAGNIPADPYDSVTIAWNGAYMRVGDALYAFIQSQLGYSAAQMTAFFVACAALPASPPP